MTTAMDDDLPPGVRLVPSGELATARSSGTNGDGREAIAKLLEQIERDPLAAWEPARSRSWRRCAAWTTSRCSGFAPRSSALARTCRAGSARSTNRRRGVLAASSAASGVAAGAARRARALHRRVERLAIRRGISRSTALRPRARLVRVDGNALALRRIKPGCAARRTSRARSRPGGRRRRVRGGETHTRTASAVLAGEDPWRSSTLARARVDRWCAHAEDFDRDEHLLNCANGMIDLRSGALVAHDPDALCSREVSCGVRARSEGAGVRGVSRAGAAGRRSARVPAAMGGLLRDGLARSSSAWSCTGGRARTARAPSSRRSITCWGGTRRSFRATCCWRARDRRRTRPSARSCAGCGTRS
jgi:hypothetical protein